MAWAETSKARPTEPGWYWVQLPNIKDAVLAEWKYAGFFEHETWWLDGIVLPEHSVVYPIRYWDKPIKRRKLPPERKARSKAPAERLGEVFP